MNKLLFFLALAILGTTSCDLINENLDPIVFSIDGDEIVYTLNEQDEAGTFSLSADNISLGIQEALDDENLSSDRLTSLQPEALIIRIVSVDAPVDLSVIESAIITVEADGLSPITLADGDLMLNADNTEAELAVEDVELLDHLLAPSADFNMSITTSAAIPEAIDLGIRPTLRASAEAL